MTKFVLTMNMPSRKGNEVHQVIAGHSAATLDEFAAEIDGRDFVVVEEFYYSSDDKSKLFSRGRTAVSCFHIGKIRMIEE